jgi:hypothetical protein
MCYVLDQCVFTHPLVEGHKLHIKDLLRGKLHENAKTARILQFFEEKQPPKYLQYSKKKKKKFNIQKANKVKVKKNIRVGRYSEPNPAHAVYWDIMNLKKQAPNFHIDK